MADPEETTRTSGAEDESPAAGSDDEFDVEDILMHQVATLQELAEANAKWLAALEPRIEAAEQRIASQLDLGQDYNRLDAQVSGLQAAFELRLKSGLHVEGEARDPVVQFGPVEGSLATLESGTGVVLGERRFVVVGPSREGTLVKVRPYGRGEAEYLPASRVPDEVLSE